jgi:pimeloyl-ACP methyl ester carboxylesterase
MKEHAVAFGRDRSLVGVMTENGTGNLSVRDNITGVLLLTAGLDHHVGPNRIYVKLARRLAEMGCVVFRFGFSGTGDSGPRRDKLPASQSVIDETRQAMDYLERLTGVKRFTLIGLCTGAITAFQVAVADSRVKGAVLVNPPAPNTVQTELMREHNYYWRYALFNFHNWMRLFFLQSDYRSVWKAVSVKIKSWLRPNYARSVEPPEVVDEITKSFQSFQERRVRLLIVSSYSESELGEEYIRKVARKEYKSMKGSGLLSTKVLRGSDHTVRPLAGQEEMLNFISEWMVEECRFG